MSEYEKYDGRPVKFLIHARTGLMDEKLWCSWLFLCLILFLLNITGVMDLKLIKIGEFVDSSIAGLSFSLIVVSAVREIFEKNELIIIYKRQNDNEKQGLLLLKVLAPYVFTSMIFLVLGIISLIAPLVTVALPINMVIMIKYLYVALLLLGLFSLFHVCYGIIINIYNSVRREVIKENIKNKEKKE
ncbi:hypothetical protein [Streptococcus parauberis]|uniref:Uncharacterized protein n=1 Tax=Streptococcus parauberis NCFD 2020 TaxID=873447 RepID=F1YXV0_9STRE|nr:hypothetical protein [Streptococcus parauberis]EGE54960.1 hypothetical protein SPB_1429 [Streptococcus parauberis NCFD 2020]